MLNINMEQKKEMIIKQCDSTIEYTKKYINNFPNDWEIGGLEKDIYDLIKSYISSEIVEDDIKEAYCIIVLKLKKYLINSAKDELIYKIYDCLLYNYYTISKCIVKLNILKLLNLEKNDFLKMKKLL